jgi:hypothetical protein
MNWVCEQVMSSIPFLLGNHQMDTHRAKVKDGIFNAVSRGQRLWPDTTISRHYINLSNHLLNDFDESHRLDLQVLLAKAMPGTTNQLKSMPRKPATTPHKQPNTLRKLARHLHQEARITKASLSRP